MKKILKSLTVSSVLISGVYGDVSTQKAILFMKGYADDLTQYETEFKNEVSILNSYLNELNISLETVYGYENIDTEKATNSDLTIFYDFGWGADVTTEVINKMVQIHQSGKPIYFLGDDLAESSSDVNWESLIGLESSDNGTDNSSVLVNGSHQILEEVSNFSYTKDLDYATATNSVTVLLTHGSYDSMVVYQDEYGKVVTQLPNLKDGGDGVIVSDENGQAILKRLFQNSVNWLLEDNLCPSNITYAQNPNSGTWYPFKTPCDVPENWETNSTQPNDFNSESLGLPPSTPIDENITAIFSAGFKAGIESVDKTCSDQNWTAEKVDNLNSGWTLNGTANQISDMSIFNSANIVWIYIDGNWRAYSSDSSMSSLIDENSIEKINSIPVDSGFWIKK